MVTRAGRLSWGFCGACAAVFWGSSPQLGLPSPPGFLRGSVSSESEVETEAQRGGENCPDPSVGVEAELGPQACGPRVGTFLGSSRFCHHASACSIMLPRASSPLAPLWSLTWRNL